MIKEKKGKKKMSKKKETKKKNPVKIVLIALAVVILAAGGVLGGMFLEEGKTLLTVKADTDVGMYEVNYTADYKLDELLEAGGVTTEDELAQYVIKVMLKGLPINVEYEVPQLACSTFIAAQPDGGYIFGRNLDNQETDFAVVRTAPKDAYASVSVVNLSFLGYNEELKPLKLFDKINMLALPYFPLDGMNEKGLAVGVLQLQAAPTNQNTEKTDVDTTLAIRALLDKCATVSEAVEMLGTFDMHASANGCYHLQIADAEGNSAVVSYVNDEMVVTEKEGAYQCATNFYLHEVPFEYEAQGMDRYEKLVEVLTASEGVRTVDEGMELLHYANIVSTEPDAEGRVYSTQWSSIYDLKNMTLTLCSDRHYDTPYVFPVAE